MLTVPHAPILSGPDLLARACFLVPSSILSKIITKFHSHVQMSGRKQVSCGRDLSCVPDLAAALQSAGVSGYVSVGTDGLKNESWERTQG